MIKKISVFMLCMVMVISASIVSSHAAVTKTEMSNSLNVSFNNGSLPSSPSGSVVASGRNAEVTYDFVEGPSAATTPTDKALRFSVKAVDDAAIKLSNAPEYNQTLWSQSWFRNGTYIFYDFKVNSFDEAYLNSSGIDEGKIFGMDVRCSNDQLNSRYMGVSKKTTLNSDGTVGNCSFTTGKWYRMRVEFSYKTHTYSAYLKDYETGETAVVAEYEPINVKARNMSYGYIEFYRPCEIVIDNFTWGETPAFGIYPLTNNSSISDGDEKSYFEHSVRVYVPSDAKTAALYLDDIKQCDIIPASSTDGFYTLGYEPQYTGEQTLRLEMTDANDNLYSDTYTINISPFTAEYVRDYGFGGASESHISSGIGGGIGSSNAITISTDEAKSCNIFSYKSSGNVFVRGCFKQLETGMLMASYKMMLKQTNADVTFAYEERSPGEVLRYVKVFGKDGKIADTNVTYEANEWYEVKFLFDTSAGKADLYINNQYITSSKFTAGSSILGLRAYLPFPEQTTQYVFDHFKMVKYGSEAPKVSSVVAEKSGTKLAEVNADADTLKFAISGLVSESVTADSVSLVSDGKVISSENVSYDEENGILSMNVKGLVPLKDAVLIIGDTVALSDNTVYAFPYKYRFNVALPTLTTISDFNISEIANSFTASAKIYYTEEDKDVMIVIAAYNGFSLEFVSLEEYTLTKGENHVSVSGKIDGGLTVKAFLMESSKLTPLCKNIIYSAE